MDNFFAVIWAAVLLVGGGSIFYFLFHTVHDKIKPESEQNGSSSKVLAFILIVIFLVVILGLAFGNNP
jgi:membrane-associated protease RseP (regulator of RpoE activity)